jgi:ribonuclease-3
VLGEINAVVSKKASNPYLAQRGYSTGLVECVYKNRSQGNIVFEGRMASTVEAIIGAVFIDSDENVTAVEEVMKVLGISWVE